MAHHRRRLQELARAWLLVGLASAALAAAGQLEQTLKFEPTSNSYSGLTFTFDARLDKQVQQRLDFEHWQALMLQASSLLHDSLNGRAHLAEVRVLIPHKFPFDVTWPALQKLGLPIAKSRRLRHADADVLVGHEGKCGCSIFLARLPA